jgi:hypothetical protein
LLALGLLAGAVGAGAVLVVAGAPLPAPGPVLLLGLVTALCVNRFALFPSEYAATAEPAVLVAAVVAFRGDAALVGPLVVALLVGPLDVLHWEQRAWIRMAYNAGNRAVAVLAAAAAALVAREVLGSSTAATAVSVAFAVAALTLVDALLSCALLRAHGVGRGEARRHLRDVDALAVPIATYGATVGFLVPGVGWWAVAMALLPAAFVPELVFARGLRHARCWRDVGTALALGAALLLLASALPVPGVPVLAVLAALAVLAGAELVADPLRPVPPLLAAAVVVAAVVAPGSSAVFAAVAVAAVGTCVAWWRASGSELAARGAGPRRWVTRWSAVVVAGTAAGAAVGGTHAVEGSPASSTATTLLVVLAGAGFAVVAVVVSGDRRRLALDATWAASLVALALAAARAGRPFGAGGAVGALVAVVAGVVAASAWGSPPWRSRALGPWVGTRSRVARWSFFLASVGGAAGAVAVTVVGASTTRHALVFVTVALAEGVVAMAAVGARQWRFAPRARARALVASTTVAAVALLAYPVVAWSGTAWSVAIVAVVLTPACAIARRPLMAARELDRTAAGSPR